MRRSPSYEIILETCIDGLNQANEMGLARGINQIFSENVKPLKSACHRMHLSIKPITNQANRYAFDERFHLYVYVLYHQDLPESFKAHDYYLKAPMQDCISMMKPSLMHSKYIIRYDKSQNKYWLYDTYNNKELYSMNDYNHSLLLNQTLLVYKDKFTKELDKVRHNQKTKETMHHKQHIA